MYITIGRDPQSDIVISGYDTVSYNHATIEYKNGEFLFIDDSSNGTTVNGKRIHHQSRSVRQGDTILLAGRCPLDWRQVMAKVDDRNAVPASRATMLHNPSQQAYNPPTSQPHAAPQQPQYGAQQPSPQEMKNSMEPYGKDLDKWNWGAFLLGWIWGVFNNVYWTLLALIPVPFLGLVVCIIAGVKGTRQAWEKGEWKDSDFTRFKKKQEGWAIAGFVVLGINLLGSILYVILQAAS